MWRFIFYFLEFSIHSSIPCTLPLSFLLCVLAAGLQKNDGNSITSTSTISNIRTVDNLSRQVSVQQLSLKVAAGCQRCPLQRFAESGAQLAFIDYLFSICRYKIN